MFNFSRCLNDGSEECDSRDFNSMGYTWYHCQYSPWIRNNAVALDCCLTESPGPAWVLGWSVLLPKPPFVISGDSTSAVWLKVSEKKGQVAFLVCLCKPLFPLMLYFSLSLSSAHQWLSLCSHPALRVNRGNSPRDTASRAHPRNIRCNQGSTKQSQLSMVRKQSYAIGQCTVHSVISLVLYCTYR